jgi:hypothetical protein
MSSDNVITISGVSALLGGAVLIALAVLMLWAARPTPDGQAAPLVRRWITAYALLFTALFSLGTTALLTGLFTVEGGLRWAVLGLGAGALLAWRILRRRGRRAPPAADEHSAPPEPRRPDPASVTDKAA